MINSITEEIIKQINRGNENAFAKLYDAYYTYLTVVGIYYVKNEDVVSEIVNDTFVNIWYKREILTYPIKAYLANSVKNACISHIRAQNTRNRILGEYKELEETAYESFIKSSPQPLQDIVFDELVEELRKAEKQLPTQCKLIFNKYFFLGKEINIIAKEMGIQESTVRVQIKNARERVKELMKHMLPLFYIFFLSP